MEDSVSKNVCVFSASSDRIKSEYVTAAQELGRLMGAGKHTLVFGGGTRGLMGALARSVHRHGGRVIGVIPDKLERPGVTYAEADELIVTETLRDRKAEMDRLSQAFIALPGGFGTLEEVIEAMTLKQLRYHSRPVVFLNTLNFYDHLKRFFDHQVNEGFVKDEHLSLFHIAATPAEAMEYIEHYDPVGISEKYA